MTGVLDIEAMCLVLKADLNANDGTLNTLTVTPGKQIPFNLLTFVTENLFIEERQRNTPCLTWILTCVETLMAAKDHGATRLIQIDVGLFVMYLSVQVYFHFIETDNSSQL